MWWEREPSTAGVNFSQVMEKKMNKIFTIYLLLIFSFGIISCADNDSSSANSKLGNVLDQPNSTDDENNMNLPVITGCYIFDNSTQDNSTIDNSSISNNSSITSSTVRNCSKVGSDSSVDNSMIDNFLLKSAQF